MKKINEKGIANHLLLLIIGSVVVGVGVFAGWRIYVNRNISANAAGYTYLARTSKGSTISACRLSTGQVKYRFVRSSLDYGLFGGYVAGDGKLDKQSNKFVNNEAYVTHDVGYTWNAARFISGSPTTISMTSYNTSLWTINKMVWAEPVVYWQTTNKKNIAFC